MLLAASLFFFCLVVYALTAARTVQNGDATEMALVFTTGSIAHPPGYALQSLTSRLLVALAFFVDPALSSNLLSGVWGAATVALVLLLLRRMRIDAAAALSAALCLGLGRTFWSQSVIAEVYTFDALLMLLALHAALSTPIMYARGWLLLGLALGSWTIHRTVNALYAPGVLLLMWACHRERLRATSVWPALRACVAGVLLSLLVIVYLPLASAFDPPIDRLEPEAFPQLVELVTGASFSHLLVFGGERTWSRLALFAGSLPRDLGVALPLALAGALRLGRARAHLLVGAFGWLCVASVGFMVSYEIPDPEAYFIVSHVALSLLAGWGAAWLLSAARRTAWRGLLVAAAMAGVVSNHSRNDVSRARQLDLLASDMLRLVPSNAVVLTHGDSIVNALYFKQDVEGAAPGVAVIYCTITADWYQAMMRRRYAMLPWPARWHTDWQDNTADLIMRIGSRRPIFTSSEIDTEAVLRRGLGEDWSRRFALVPKGLLTRVVPRNASLGAFDVLDEARATLAVIEPSARTLDATKLDIDVDNQITHLQYVMALLRTGRQLDDADPVLAARAYDLAAALEPAAFEEAYLHEQSWRLGVRLPPLGLARDVTEARRRSRASPR